MRVSDALDEPAGLGQGARRRLIFLYQDGIVLAATLRGMAAAGLLPGNDVPSAAAVCSPKGFANLRVGLRTLAQAGWIEDCPALSPETLRLRWTHAGEQVLAGADDYLAVGQFLARFDDSAPTAWLKPWTQNQVADFAALSDRAARGWDLPETSLSRAHLDGALLTPLLLQLQAEGRVGTGRPVLHGHESDTLRAVGWLDPAGDWTAIGLAGIQITAHLGLTGSYLPMLARLPELYNGSVVQLSGTEVAGREWHVQRELNIAASTAAHGRYFADADALIRPIFDAEPLAAQPAFILDVGCGDGAWLARVARLVRGHTLRGRRLEQFPLRIVGVDHAPAAVERARHALAVAGIAALVVTGDVSDPEGLARQLAGHGLDLADALHLHGFIDHDRTLADDRADAAMPAQSTGIYIGPYGEPVAPAAVEADLVRHLARWAPYLQRHGLIALEAHCVPAAIAARHQGALHSIAFDAYHGYSRQYPIERGAYVDAVRRAGLRPAAVGGRCYPASRPFVAVSLNHLRAARPAPNPGGVCGGDDGSDGMALHRLLYRDGDIDHPRPWCAPATRALIGQAMIELDRRLERLPEGATLRVCDYGTGTGLAAIELAKACRERGFDARLVARGVSLDLLCLDIPSAWFDQGQALLRDCGWARFRALTDASGRFRPLIEVTDGASIDLLLASMVFHLIRPPAFARLVASFAEILAPDGILLWNAPDIGPAGPWSVLFHDANRALRARWEAMLAGAMPPGTMRQCEAVARAARDASGAPLIEAARAGRRILATPNDASALHAMLARRLKGGIQTQAHEMTAAEVLDVLHVPSNHREFLPEISTDAERLAVIDEMMANDILPAMLAGPAGTGPGVAVHWTSGAYRKA